MLWLTAKHPPGTFVCQSTAYVTKTIYTQFHPTMCRAAHKTQSSAQDAPRTVTFRSTVCATKACVRAETENESERGGCSAHVHVMSCCSCNHFATVLEKDGVEVLLV